MPDIEYAAVKMADGTPVARTEAHRSFAKFQAALARTGGRAPLDADGCSMLWNEVRDWHPRDGHQERAKRPVRSHFAERLEEAESELAAQPLVPVPHRRARTYSVRWW